MRPRNAAVVLCCAVLGGCELVAGGLPDPVRPDAGTAGAAGVAGSGGASGGTGGTADSGAGAGGQAGQAGQAGQGGSAGCQSQCDCDGDGAKSMACGGGDCDDHDPDVKPGQSSYFAVPAQNPAIGFDYDCSGGPERDPSQGQVKCAALSLGSCTTAKGFLVDPLPQCGESADWGDCTPGTLSCKNEVISQQTMRCH